MAQNSINNKYFDFKFDNSQKIIEKFKRHINKYNCPEITLDLSNLNIIDATKIMVLSSTYHYQKYPKGKLKCHIPSEDIKSFVSNFTINNLELV